MYKILYTVLYILLFFSNSLQSNFYNEDDINKMFGFFKTKYGKTYKNVYDESRARNNYIKNFGKVEALNEKNTDKGQVYFLNKFADSDAEQLKEQYAVNITPYDNLRNKGIRENEKKITINEGDLYDLDDAKVLYKSFLKENQKNYTKKWERKVHYYKFVQTLVKINEQRLHGINVTLDENADVLEEPYEYIE